MIVALGGCALAVNPQGATSASVAAGSAAGAAPAVSEFDGFLANALAGESHTLDLDGQRVRVTAGERYAAASGRDCRRFRVSASSAGLGDTAQQQRVACVTPEGWRTPRAVLANAVGR